MLIWSWSHVSVGHIILEPSELFFGRRQKNSGFWRYISLNTHEAANEMRPLSVFTKINLQVFHKS